MKPARLLHAKAGGSVKGGKKDDKQKAKKNLGVEENKSVEAQNGTCVGRVKFTSGYRIGSWGTTEGGVGK